MSFDPPSAKSLISCGAVATARSVFITCCTHPIDLVKIKLQDAPEAVKARVVAQEILKNNGPRGFFEGLGPQISRLMIKEWWRWPALIYLPGYLEKIHAFKPITSQIITGLFISTVDATTTAPLEKYRIRAMAGKSLQHSSILSNGWSGFLPLWWKNSVGWISFSLSQRLVRDSYKRVTKKEELSPLDLMVTGTAVGCIVGLCLAPFDMTNTQGQLGDVKMHDLIQTAKKMYPRQLFRYFFRGSLLQMSLFSLHNITSVALIEKLS